MDLAIDQATNSEGRPVVSMVLDWLIDDVATDTSITYFAPSNW
jgi:hypothetical protein